MAASLSQATADAQAGNADAQYALSQFYFAKRDESQALHWLQQAAKQQLPEAEFSLAQWQLACLRSETELLQAHSGLCRAAAAGMAKAQVAAAKTELMLSGRFDERIAAARCRLEQAAGAGDGSAQRQLAMWSGSTEVRNRLLQQATAAGDDIARQLLNAVESEPTKPTPTTASPLPGTQDRLLDYGHSVSRDNCAYIIATARPLLRPSFIIDPQTGERRPHPIRRSSGAALDYFSMDAVSFGLVRQLCERIGIAWQRCEPINVLNYQVGDEYRLHHDAFEYDPLVSVDEKDAPLNQRSHTALLYLNSVPAGGETQFPKLQQQLAPVAGNLYCFSNLANGKADPDMLHAGAPVTKGSKWLMTLWLREKPLLLSTTQKAPEVSS